MKRFRGWEPVTRYDHDDAGRLIASQPEPEWDERSQAEMLALAAYRRARCPNCGGDLAETTAAENEDRYQHELPAQCHRCVAFARAADAYADQPHPHTFMHIVKLRPKRG